MKLFTSHNYCASVPMTHASNRSQAGRRRQGDLWSSLQDVCNLLNLDIALPPQAQTILFAHRRVKAGQRIFASGQAFEALYLVHSGFLKNILLDSAGVEHVRGFPMRRDVLGMDGISSGAHPSEAIALTDVDVIVLPFKELSTLARTISGLEDMIYRILSGSMAREQAALGSLGILSAEARVARFLVTLSERFEALGYSGREFQLRMTRQEIGSYLGLTLETVSRAFSALDAAGLIGIEQRNVQLYYPEKLRTVTRLAPSAAKRPKREAVAHTPMASSTSLPSYA